MTWCGDNALETQRGREELNCRETPDTARALGFRDKHNGELPRRLRIEGESRRVVLMHV